MKKSLILICISIIFLSMALFLPVSNAYQKSMQVDEIIWQYDQGLNPSSLSAEVIFENVDSNTFNLFLYNTSTYTDPDDPNSQSYLYDYPATILLTGIGFNLLGAEDEYGNVLPDYLITGGDVDEITLVGGSSPPEEHWGYDNYTLNSGYYQTAPAGVTTKSVNTSVSTMKAASQDGLLSLFSTGKANTNGPDYGVLSESFIDATATPPEPYYQMPYPYFEGYIKISIDIALRDSETPVAFYEDDWQDFFEQIDGYDLVVGFGSPTAAVPEPATMLLLGTGLIGLAGFGRKRFKKN